MSSRKEQKEALRQERLEREQRAAATERRKRLVGLGVAGFLVAAAVVAVAVVLLSGGGGEAGGGASEQASAGEFPQPSGPIPAAQTTDLEQAVDDAGCKLEEDESEGSEHVAGPVTYRSNPPSSGNHVEEPTADGPYTEAPPTEMLVHALEHGRILIQYAPDAPDEVKGDLKALFDEDPYHMLVSPNGTDMPYEVAATAWTQTVGCPQMNDKAFDAIRAFREEFRDKGPEFVP